MTLVAGDEVVDVELVVVPWQNNDNLYDTEDRRGTSWHFGQSLLPQEPIPPNVQLHIRPPRLPNTVPVTVPPSLAPNTQHDRSENEIAAAKTPIVSRTDPACPESDVQQI